MIDTWQQFLSTRGAVFLDEAVAHFGDPATELQHASESPILADLSHFGLIECAGADAQAFLQGQLSNDVRLLNERTSQFSSYCTPKGRMLASFLLWQTAPDAYVMQLPASLQAAIQKRLSLFVLRSKVTLTDASGRFLRLGLGGPGADAAAAQVFGALPENPHDVMRFEGGHLLRPSSNLFEVVLPPEAAKAVWARLVALARPAGAAVWDWLLIQAGLPTILPATQEQFVPQMVNFELIGGVSFKKGCYPGQEIVARTQYLGKLKRRMYLGHLDQAARPGDELFSADMGDQSCGMIVNAAPAPVGGHDVLAVIQISSVAAGSVHWGSLSGPALALRPLPYAVPT